MGTIRKVKLSDIHILVGTQLSPHQGTHARLLSRGIFSVNNFKASWDSSGVTAFPAVRNHSCFNRWFCRNKRFLLQICSGDGKLLFFCIQMSRHRELLHFTIRICGEKRPAKLDSLAFILLKLVGRSDLGGEISNESSTNY